MSLKFRLTRRWREPDSNRRSPVGVLNNKSGDKGIHLGIDHRARRSDNPGAAHPVRDPVHQCRDRDRGQPLAGLTQTHDRALLMRPDRARRYREDKHPFEAATRKLDR